MNLRAWTPAHAARALLRRALDISDEETSCAARGFRVEVAARRERLDAIGRSFAAGYRAALAAPDPADVARGAVARIEASLRGFAFEGAAMALALRDRLQPIHGDRVERFLAGEGAPYRHLVHVGVGWARARLGRPPAAFPRGLDPLLRWLCVDGYGFHQGFFAPDAQLRGAAPTTTQDAGVQSVLDQGLGRSLWFVEGMDVPRIAEAIGRFPPARRDDMWSGVGLACAYAGGADASELAALRAATGASWRHVAQGACFAAEARALGGNPTQDADLACHILCGVDAEGAARIARSTQPRIDGGDVPVSAYLDWRRAVREALPPRSDA